MLDHSRRQLEALLDVSKIIAQYRDLNALFHELAVRLHSVVESDFLTLVLHDPKKKTMRLRVLETRLDSEKPVGTEYPVEGNRDGQQPSRTQMFSGHGISCSNSALRLRMWSNSPPRSSKALRNSKS